MGLQPGGQAAWWPGGQGAWRPGGLVAWRPGGLVVDQGVSSVQGSTDLPYLLSSLVMSVSHWDSDPYKERVASTSAPLFK